VKTLAFYNTSSLKKAPFRAEAPNMVHFREYHSLVSPSQKVLESFTSKILKVLHFHVLDKNT